jgi:hypothetical protein
MPILMSCRLEPDEWTRKMSSPACAEKGAPPTAYFFPETGQHEERKAAIDTCRRCPIKRQCLEMHILEEFGIYGGLTGNQRSRLRKKMGLVGGQ